MLTSAGHLTYCSNIHAGESWSGHFAALKKYFPAVKKNVSPNIRMGIGLRLSNEASLDLIREEQLVIFSAWLKESDAYVFTLNGFPYGGFHHVRVKDQVHEPDWTTTDRVNYTIRLFRILEKLLPEGMDGGVSTSPLSYRHWFGSADTLKTATQKATHNILLIAEELIRIQKNSGKVLHLDIEPEPDGILESGAEFMDWYENVLLPAGHAILTSKLKISPAEVTMLLKAHIQLCYDVCHFAIGYEDQEEVIRQLKQKGIGIGKIQISAALKGTFADANERAAIREAFRAYDEPVYLHQVVARKEDGSLLHYPDLAQAIDDADDPDVREWRAHFHVPVFAGQFGILESTQNHIRQMIRMQRNSPVTRHLEIETYTWEVLPSFLKLPLQESIVREIQWVMELLDEGNAKS